MVTTDYCRNITQLQRPPSIQYSESRAELLLLKFTKYFTTESYRPLLRKSYQVQQPDLHNGTG